MGLRLGPAKDQAKDVLNDTPGVAILPPMRASPPEEDGEPVSGKKGGDTTLNSVEFWVCAAILADFNGRSLKPFPAAFRNKGHTAGGV